MNIWETLKQPFFALAPMEDVTDTAFRRLVIECGPPDLFFTEFTSVDGLLSKGVEQVAHRLRYHESERPLIAQIWGSDPEKYLSACKLLSEMGFDGIDINMGCPVGKIIKNGACSALIENHSLAKEIYLAACEGAGALPVSIKTRLGFRKWCTEEWGGFLLELSPPAITLHGRIASQLSKKPANWDEIAKVVKMRNSANSKTVIVGNGDVRTLEDGMLRVQNTGVNGVMIGRGIFDNIFIFNRDAIPLEERSVSEKLQLLLLHLDLFESTWQSKKPFRVLKKYFKIYVQNFPGASELRSQLVEAEDGSEVRTIINTWCYHCTTSSIEPEGLFTLPPT